MWPIIEEVLAYLYDLHHLGYYHGDLQPMWIKFTNNRVVKVQNPLIYTSYKNSYNYRLSNDNYKSTFSPELLKNYEFRDQSIKVNWEKCDVFSFGISILSAACKKDWTIFYDFLDNKV